MAPYKWTDGELVTAEKLNAYSEGMEQIKTDTEAAQAAAETARDTAEQKANDAVQSAQSAENARADAEEKANAASISAGNAEASAIDAAAAETAAEVAKTAAETAKSDAQTAATDASESKAAAEQLAIAAAESAESAAQSATSASESATAAQQSKEAAALSESNALASENAAAESAASALESKNAAAESANAAAASETNAATSAVAALSAQEAAEAARDQAQSIVGGDFANHTLITIPAGRMRGDVDGDSKFTVNMSNVPDLSTDVGLIFAHITGSQKLTDATQLLCADVNNDGLINQNDISCASNLASGFTRAGAYTEVTGNWTNNPNYATEEGQFYTDIAITGMTANHSASVIVKGTYENGFFPKAECVDGAIRIYAKLCPIEALTAVVSWGTGDGTAVITTESEDLTAYDTHISNTDIHITADEKAEWSNKEVFIAEYGNTTSAEIEAAYQAGKICALVYNKKTYFLQQREGSVKHYFLALTGSSIIFNAGGVQCFMICCISDVWSEPSLIAVFSKNILPKVTTDDNGKILKVVDGVWTAVTPS